MTTLNSPQVRFDIPLCNCHIVSLSNQHAIKVVYCNRTHPEPEFNLANRSVVIPLITKSSHYWHSLFQIAHIILGHKDWIYTPGINSLYDWDAEIKYEIAAWEWVWENSHIEIDPRFQEKIHLERLKGSWEAHT